MIVVLSGSLLFLGVTKKSSKGHLRGWKIQSSGRNDFVGIFYENGLHGLPLDQSKTVELYKRASELGSDKGHYNLGHSYRKGKAKDIDRNITIKLQR